MFEIMEFSQRIASGFQNCYELIFGNVIKQQFEVF